MSRPLAQHQRPDCNEPRDQLEQGKPTVELRQGNSWTLGPVELGEKPIEDIEGASALFMDTIGVLMHCNALEVSCIQQSVCRAHYVQNGVREYTQCFPWDYHLLDEKSGAHYDSSERWWCVGDMAEIFQWNSWAMLGRPLGAWGEGPLLFRPNSKAVSWSQCAGHSRVGVSFERNVTILGSLGCN